MTKYIVSTEDCKQLKKIKRENDAISFVTDVKNLAQYGSMSLTKITDDGKFIYVNDTGEWRKVG